MLFSHDATYYGQGIKEGQWSCLELTQACLANTEKLDPLLNAITEVYTESAIEQAKARDLTLAKLNHQERQELSPFYGLPYLLKDLGQFFQGHPTTAGSSLLLKDRASQTDLALQQGQKAGLVYWGRSNVPEFGLKTVSDSKYFGKVANPLNLAYNPGGSSGGAAAAVKSGMAPIAAASDAGGSIRVPASDTGLIGLKPSRGRIAQGPSRYRPVNGLATQLVLAKSVRDVFNALKVFQSDQLTAIHHLPVIQESLLHPLDRPLKIAYSSQDPRGNKLSNQAQKALKKAVSSLRDLGHEVIEIDLPVDYDAVMAAYYTIMATETGYLVHQLEKKGQSIDFEALDPLTWVTYQLADQMPASAYIHFAGQQDQWVESMQMLLQDWDLFLTPTCSAPAVKNSDLVYPQGLLDQIQAMANMSFEQKWQVAKTAFDFTYLRTSYCPLLNITGQPGISLPIYQDETGLAMGVHFTAAVGKEYLLLQIAQALEAQGKLHAEICKLIEPA